MPIGALIGAGVGLLGSSMQAGAASDAAAANVEAARIAAEAQKFRPVGVTTRFGTSQFTKDDQGNIIGAGYNVAPDIAAMRDRLFSQAGGEQFSQQALQQAQGLFGLGQQFLPPSAQYQGSPEAQAYAAQLRGLSSQIVPSSYDPTAASQQYVQQQQALLRPERERQLAQTRLSLFNTGRGGLSIAQGGDLQATNPEMAAYYNALAQQDARLAAEGSQVGRQQLAEDIKLGTTLGAGALQTQQQAEDIARQRLLSDIKTGTGLFGTGLDIATAGYNPLKTQFGLGQTMESAGQGALDLGLNIGGRTSQGAANAANTIYNAQTAANATNAYSPMGAMFSGAAGNKQWMSGLGNMFSGSSGTFQADPGAYSFGSQSWD